MDQNQTVEDNSTTNPSADAATTTSVDNDLQKAIDNITNTTSVDPVFSDPVAAPSSVPEGDTGELGEPVGPFPAPEPEPEPTPEPKIEPPVEQPTPEPVTVPTPTEQPLSTSEVKKAALRDLVPLLDKINATSSEKFRIYRDIFDDLKDYTVLESAYKATRDMSDDKERADALLYLIKSIDNM